MEYKIYVPDAIPDKHKRISDLIQRKFNLKIKKYTSGKKIAAEYGQAIFELMNEAYAPLYGFSALSQGQIDQYIKMYLPWLFSCIPHNKYTTIDHRRRLMEPGNTLAVFHRCGR